MPVYDSSRVLTVREMRTGDVLHSGLLAGKCVKWTVLDKMGQRAIVKLGDSRVLITGHDLRESPYYLADNCPNCAVNYVVPPSVVPELFTIPREILAADVPSSFRFRAAQYGRMRKTR